jgi:hypothetical protein
VETKGKTLEEIDALFDGEKRTSALDEEQVRSGEDVFSLEVIKGALVDSANQKSR